MRREQRKALLNHISFQLCGMEVACGGVHLWAEGDPVSPRHPRTGLKALAHWCDFSAPTAKGEQMQANNFHGGRAWWLQQKFCSLRESNSGLGSVP